jgi:hypothetical protein
MPVEYVADRTENDLVRSGVLVELARDAGGNSVDLSSLSVSGYGTTSSGRYSLGR